MLSYELATAIKNALEEKLGNAVQVNNTQQVYGGDINKTYLLQTTAGTFFLKINSDGLPMMFAKEYNGLLRLSATGALAVPRPIAAGNVKGQIFLVMEYMEKGKAGAGFWKVFAHGLAALHRNTCKYFGLEEDNYIGTIAQPNNPAYNWPEFYTGQRIMPLIHAALQQGKCTLKDVQLTEGLCRRFDKIFPREPPALLHGDLWGGNFMVGEDGQPIIYDPAVYYGHREMDIAMTLLFGGFDKKFYDYYNDAWPLEQGWQQRVQLCQLYPLLVHLLLFGGHYYSNLMEIIKRY